MAVVLYHEAMNILLQIKVFLPLFFALVPLRQKPHYTAIKKTSFNYTVMCNTTASASRVTPSMSAYRFHTDVSLTRF